MPSTQIYAGATTGLADAATYLAGSDKRQADLKAAKYQQDLAQTKLDEFNSNKGNRDRTNELQVQQLEAQTKSINTQSLSASTYSAFDRFKSDNNSRHLNTWLAESKKNPVGASLYGGITRYDNLTKSDLNDKMLTSAGYNPEDVYNNPDIANDFIVVTNNDGNQSLLPKESMYAATGYNNYLTDQELEEQEKRARIAQALRDGKTMTQIEQEQAVLDSLMESGKAKTLDEAYKLLQQMKKQGNGRGIYGTAKERAIERVMQEYNLDYGDALAKYAELQRGGRIEGTNESRYIEEYLEQNPGAAYEQASSAYANRTATSTQKEVGQIKGLREALDKENWLETNPADLKTSDRARIYTNYIGPLEDLRGFKISNEDKRTVRQLRDLTALGKGAGDNLTPDETGILDSTLNKFKSYMFNEVGGKEATSNYNSFRNIFRNALYGASLTQTEVDSFNQAAGTLGQKFMPVMEQLKTQMSTIMVNLEAIRDLNDPHIAHYYTGQSIEDIDRAIEQIENRMNDPRLQWNKENKGSKLSSKDIVPTQDKQVREASATTPPQVDSTVPSTFDFDSAMNEANL